ncbi:hypothetical protein EYF80_030595 [Liparis tanakae]|uniref:Uncharacterized protein n=1 Tax=Liparis tanakae TaxID=230148 RepID=A0A4Z2H2Y3_9TELE|nr:hypothetical protein EYF80_030595 [Liparis tanakae]
MRSWVFMHSRAREYEASPAELMFQRKINTKIPMLTTTSDNSTDHIIRERDEVAKAKMKSNSDSHRHAKPSTLTPGDTFRFPVTRLAQSRFPMTRSVPHVLSPGSGPTEPPFPADASSPGSRPCRRQLPVSRPCRP